MKIPHSISAANKTAVPYMNAGIHAGIGMLALPAIAPPEPIWLCSISPADAAPSANKNCSSDPRIRTIADTVMPGKRFMASPFRSSGACDFMPTVPADGELETTVPVTFSDSQHYTTICLKLCRAETASPGQTHFEIWEEFVLKGHGFSRAAQSRHENVWPLGPEGEGVELK